MEPNDASGMGRASMPNLTGETPVRCKFCNNDVDNYLKQGSVYCPFCGAVINAARTPGQQSKDSNLLTGRALWPAKWSVLGVVLGMLLLLAFGIMIPVIIVIAVIAPNPEPYLSDPTALEQLIVQLLLNPWSTALLSLTEFGLIVPPIVVLKKYRKSFKERIMLLGWRPYFGEPARGQTGWPRFARDIGFSTFLAVAMVGFQFLVVILNDAIWAPLIPASDPLAGLDQSITPQDPFQFMALVASMLLVIGPTEEMLFRGFAQQGLEAHTSERNAWFISVLMFTIVHVTSGFVELSLLPYMFFPYFYLSMVFCAIYTKTKNLNLMIFIHGIYDALLVLLSYIGSASELAAIVYMSVCCVVCFAAGVYYLYRWIFAGKKTSTVVTTL
nr:CPBP family glutamic-type intramembrane protease [Candidatus Sigynarchaeota archaeon]